MASLTASGLTPVQANSSSCRSRSFDRLGSGTIFLQVHFTNDEMARGPVCPQAPFNPRVMPLV